MRLFSKTNPALAAAKKLHAQALMGQLKAQQDLDWAQSMILYHTQRAESLGEFIAKVEALDAKAAPAERGAKIVVDNIAVGFGVDPTRSFRDGGLTPV